VFVGRFDGNNRDSALDGGDNSGPDQSMAVDGRGSALEGQSDEGGGVSAAPRLPQVAVDAVPAAPEPIPAPEPDAPAWVWPSAAEVEALICSYSWPCGEALAVVYGPTPPNERAPVGCPNGESGGNPSASNGDHAGLFQISRRWHEWRFLRRGWTWADAFDAERNIAVAYEIWVDNSGWSPWSCKP